MFHEDGDREDRNAASCQPPDPNEDDAMYDMFVGAVHSDDDSKSKESMTGAREGAAAEVNIVAREILHLAMKMGVKPQSYGAQLRATMGQFAAWSNGEGDEDCEPTNAEPANALATEELMCMSEKSPGEVNEMRRRPEVAEIYSPPRVTALLPNGGLYPGVAMDLTTNDDTGRPWDFDDAAQRQKARERLRADQPLVLIGSPMCTAFCRLQSINFSKMHPDRVRAILAKARMHLNFVCSLYEEQIRGGRFFIHEHPAGATSWEEPAVKRILKLPEVRVSRVDACQYGMTGVSEGKEHPVKKPTRWMSNMKGVNEVLSKTCGGKGGLCSDGRAHVSCTGKRAERAAIYPLRLCRAILLGIRKHLMAIGWLHEDCNGIMMGAEEVAQFDMEKTVSEMCYEELIMADDQRRRGTHRRSGTSGKTYDALTRQLLEEDLVIQGKETEMALLHQWRVYDYADYSEAYDRTGKKPISTKWVCTNKGDDMAPNVRCRWVAREFRDDQDVIFAATAPYESIRLLLSIAAAKEETSHKGKIGMQRLQISMVDVRRAYFNAVVSDDTPVYVELPPEDPEHGRKCGRLRRHLYGTRGAAAGWEDEYSAFMTDVGFQRGIASGCLFHHVDKDLRVVVYGDDFTIVGSCEQVNWFEETMEQRYAITKRGRLGSSPEYQKELTLLNRVVRWVDGVGIEVEADPRQAERLIAQMGMIGAKAVGTPGVKPTTPELEADEVIEDSRGKVHQAGSARSNYVGVDRPETQFATKECCRQMARPTELSLKALKRIARFMVGRPRLVMKMKFEEESKCVDVYVDSDYAGCPRTRKSTSGGCIMMGSHLIKTWSSTQKNAISLSSGKAELYAMVKGVGSGIGVQQYLADLGVHAGLRVHTDSSAAEGICKIVGLGTQRHIAVNSLWVQEKLRRK
jgi:hypothetical protein